MSSDAIAQILLQVLLVATALFVIRLFWVRVPNRYPLYVLSMGLAVVFLVPGILPEMGQVKMAGLEMISLAMDIFIAPFVAMELFRTVTGEEQNQTRFLAPAIASVVAAGVVAVYATSGPDMDSLQDVFEALLMLDTLVSVVIVGYVTRKFRNGTPPGDSNTMWIRRYFFFTAVADLIGTIAEVSVDAAAWKGIRIVFLSASVAATLGCLLVLRKPKTESAPAA
jgi:hypothetical protein